MLVPAARTAGQVAFQGPEVAGVQASVRIELEPADSLVTGHRSASFRQPSRPLPIMSPRSRRPALRPALLARAGHATRRGARRGAVEVAQPVPQERARSEEVGLDRPDRHPEDIGHLFVG